MDSSVAKDVQTIVPDLILINHLLGDGYGSYLCKKLKGDPIIANTPIILFSAVNGLEIIAKVACADGFLLKPLEFQQAV